MKVGLVWHLVGRSIKVIQARYLGKAASEIGALAHELIVQVPAQH